MKFCNRQLMVPVNTTHMTLCLLIFFVQRWEWRLKNIWQSIQLICGCGQWTRSNRWRFFFGFVGLFVKFSDFISLCFLCSDSLSSLYWYFCFFFLNFFLGQFLNIKWANAWTCVGCGGCQFFKFIFVKFLLNFAGW